MPFYLFSQPFSTPTVMIARSLCKKVFRLYEVLGVERQSGKYQVQLIQDLSHFPGLKKYLMQGTRCPLTNGDVVYIKCSRIFFVRKLSVQINHQGYHSKRINFSQIAFK